MENIRALVAKMKAELPPEAFQPQPTSALIDIPCLTIIIAGMWALIHLRLPWYAALTVAFFMGNACATMGFLAHEALHGAVFRSRKLQEVLGYLGFFVFCFSPYLWRFWHNQAHHGNTNQPDLDPDSYGTLERFQRVPQLKFQVKTGIGSGHWSSLFFLFYRFTCHALVMIWLASPNLPGFERMNRRRVIIESAMMASFWIVLGIWGGFQVALFGIVIPMMIANFILMSYISTNHFLRPLTETDESLLNSMSVRTLKWIDILHLNFSHHVEHHIFSRMNHRFTPLVREYLVKYAPDLYVAPPHWKALWYLYKTPRVYLNVHTLIDPFTGRTMDLHELAAELKDQPLAVIPSA
ncbi:MAG: acyl-CoA desaturase [Candidatus Binatota bacterium]